jgi:uncharacterized Zn-finger protein
MENSNSRIVKVTEKDLPLYCPTPQMELWSMHPKVSLSLDEVEEAICPYCGTKYVR